MPTGNLPAAGAALHKKVYDEALKGSCKGDKQCAAKEAWAAVKGAGYEKVGDKWVKKSDVVQEFSMYFSKVGPNTKKWQMTASDTLLDRRNEAMSLELYKSFMDNIETDSPVPKPFDAIVTDSFWNGGMPYLSIAHYSDLEGEGIPGDTHAVYVDGNQLKAKGVFNDTPLGVATWKALLADRNNPQADNKIRVSIGFLDLAHRHGDFVFERKSFEDTCPMCEQGAGNKTYLRGYLVHLAMTRKPVNPRSEVEVDLSMTTRKEDAASIVGEELAQELSEKQKALAQFSDVLVERAAPAPAEDNDADEMMASGTSSDMPMENDADTVLVEEAVTKTEGGCSHPSSHYLVVGDPQKVTTWHLRFKDCQGNVDSRLLGAAKAALTSPGGHRGNKYAGPDKAAAIAKLKRLYSSQGLKWEGDVDEEISQDVTFEELSMAEDVAELIQNAPVIDETEPTIKDVMDALGKLTELVTPTPVEKTPVDMKYESLAEVMKSAMAESIPAEEKLVKIQPALNELAETIKEVVTKPAVQADGTPVAPNVQEMVNEAIRPLMEQISMLSAKVSQSTAVPTETRVPQPRSINALAVKSLVATEQKKLTPMEQIAARSVGLEVE